MVDVAQIEQLFKKHFRHTGVVTHIDPTTGKVDVDGFVVLRSKLKQLPVQFEHVTDTFDCSDNKLTTLMGAPQSVRGRFVCDSNQLTSLAHAPEYVGRDFICNRNQLTNLVGAPEEVGVDFNCHSNPLTSLEGAPSVIPGMFWVSYSATLPLLRTLVAQAGVACINAPPEVEQILNDPEFKGKGRAGAIKCALALIKAGYRENARW
jgi:hypothetical protein